MNQSDRALEHELDVSARRRERARNTSSLIAVLLIIQRLLIEAGIDSCHPARIKIEALIAAINPETECSEVDSLVIVRCAIDAVKDTPIGRKVLWAANRGFARFGKVLA